MKPKFIFSTVGAICLFMLIVLPSLATHRPAVAQGGSQVAAVQATALPTSAPAAGAAAPTLAPLAEQAAAGAAAEPTLAQAAEPAAGAAGEVLIPSDGSDPALAAQVEQASIPDTALPSLADFVNSVINRVPGQVTGIYVPGLFALPVVQQPQGDYNFVSPEDHTATQFSKPAAYDVTGLLAHNYLSGQFFSMIPLGQQFFIVFGDGAVDRYQVNDIQHYQALEPHSTASDFIDLDHPGSPQLSHLDLFQRVYTTPGQVVLQTCIASDGELSWGRIFIIAGPA